MYRDSMGANALTLDYMLVTIFTMEGRHVKNTTDPLVSLFNPTASLIYVDQQERLFDRTDIDEAILKRLAKEIKADRQKSIMSPLQAGQSLASAFLGKDVPEKKPFIKSKSEIEKMLETSIPSELTWEMDETGQEVAAFIENDIPFPKTRNWLFNQLSQMIAAETDRFFSRISIQTRPVYAMH